MPAIYDDFLSANEHQTFYIKEYRDRLPPTEVLVTAYIDSKPHHEVYYLLSQLVTPSSVRNYLGIQIMSTGWVELDTCGAARQLDDDVISYLLHVVRKCVGVLLRKRPLLW